MANYLHTMLRITDPEQSRRFYEALGFTFSRDMEIVRNGELEATNYFYSLSDHDNVLELAEGAARAGESENDDEPPGEERILELVKETLDARERDD